MYKQTRNGQILTNINKHWNIDAMINPISVTCMQNQSKPGHEHRHSGSGSQFDTHPTGIGLNDFIF